MNTTTSSRNSSSSSGVSSWMNLAPMHEPRESFAAVSHRNKIYVFGGSTLKTAEVYDLGTCIIILKYMTKSRNVDFINLIHLIFH